MSSSSDVESDEAHAQFEIAQRLQKVKAANERAAVETGQISGLGSAADAGFEHSNQTRLLRRREVEAFTGLSRSTLYDWMKRGEFPQPVKLGARLVAWRESDIREWLETRETRKA
ncbi:helix-turn-helix transcriptional regulator [Antarctobacter jejuensis]|uniref:helix-turn-helix transcriptional regulator n=1 Tax=Antarctobacter jejuensis TaxID=1439938 RepID=UPI003FD0D8C3